MGRHYRTALATALLVSGATLQLAPSQAQGNGPKIIPPHANFRGLSYGEWVAKWNQAVLAIPVVGGDHPVFSGSLFGEEKGVRFLAGLTGPVTVEVTIPAGTALFFPIITAEVSSLEPPPFFGATYAEQRAAANYFMDLVSGAFAVIDGLAVERIGRFRVESPQYSFTVPADNILGVPGPASGTSVAAGFYLLVAPLSVGTHTIHFGAAIDLFGYVLNTTYVVTVTPRH